MLSDNQRLQISCDKQQLQMVLRFALQMYHEDLHKTNLCYQVVENEALAIGCFYSKVEDGWNKFMFDHPSMELLTATVKQFVEQCKKPQSNRNVDYTETGYLISGLREYAKSDAIKNRYDCIFVVEPFCLEYSK